MGIGKKRTKKEKEREILLVGVTSQEDLLACCQTEDLQEKASVGVYPAEYLLAVLRPSANKQEDFVQFKKVTILLLLVAFS